MTPQSPRKRSTAKAARDCHTSPLSGEVRWYLRTRGYQLPRWCRPAVRTPEPRDFPGAMFDPDRVDHVIQTLGMLRHTKGKWAGKPLKPDAWQVAYVIAPVFGWVAPDDHGRLLRIIRNCYLDVPRKAGKTTIASGLGLYLAFADGENGAEVLAVAGSRDQAGNAYRPAKLIAEKSPEMQEAGIRPLQAEISRPADGSFFKAVASVGDLIHGSHVSGAIVDELHIHKSPDVLDAVESGTGARDQPLVLIITTPDDGSPNTVYATTRGYIDRLAAGTIHNPRQYGVVFSAAESDSPTAEATWRKANPGYGVSPTKAFLQAESRKAMDSPANLARFQRLHLGIRTKQQSRYLLLADWDRNSGMVREEKLSGRRCFGGLDLAATSDLSALAWVFPSDDGGIDLIWRFWVPEARIAALDETTANAATEWVRRGWLAATPGNVADYDFIRAQVARDLEAFDHAEIGYDPWNATQLVNDLVSDGANMVQVRQSFSSLSPSLKELQRMLRLGTANAPMVRHGGNPTMRWMIDNLAVAMDASGNVKPDKAKSAQKIDGVSALVTALSRMFAEPAEEELQMF